MAAPTHPVVTAVLTVGGLWVLYRTGLYAASMRHPTVLLLVHVHVFLAGWLFTHSLVGPDPAPHRPGLARPRRRPRARRRRARRPGQDAYAHPPAGVDPGGAAGRGAGHVLRRRTRGDRLVRAPRRRMVPSAGTTRSAPAVERKAMPTTSTRLWVPRQVLVTRSAAELPHTAQILAAGARRPASTDVEFLRGDRLTGAARRDDERETYARAKSTLAVVVSPPSQAEAAADPAERRLAGRPGRGLPGPLPVLLPRRLADRPAGDPGVRRPRRDPRRPGRLRRPRAR